MRRGLFVMCLLLAGMTGVSAHADPGAVEAAATTEDYLVKTVTITQGKELIFANFDLLNAHTLTAWAEVDGVPLFDSASVNPRKTKTMTDVAAVPVGDYGYYCKIHSSMSGVLQVR